MDLFDNLADEILRVNRVTFLDGEVLDLSGVRR
jgi:hypothetical protein